MFCPPLRFCWPLGARPAFMSWSVLFSPALVGTASHLGDMPLRRHSRHQKRPFSRFSRNTASRRPLERPRISEGLWLRRPRFEEHQDRSLRSCAACDHLRRRRVGRAPAHHSSARQASFSPVKKGYGASAGDWPPDTNRGMYSRTRSRVYLKSVFRRRLYCANGGTGYFGKSPYLTLARRR